MARNDKRRQKKLEKKRMERKKKAQQIARVKSGGMPVLLASAANWPIYKVLRADFPEDEGGLESFLFIRRGNDGRFLLVSFLVDTYCLGVKDTFARVMPGDLFATWEEQRLDGGVVSHVSVPAPLVRKIVEESVAYARSIGIEPHRDYAMTSKIFGDVDASSCTEEFVFGFNGKPYYVSGPDDSPMMQRRICELVTKAGGHYTVGANGRGFAWDDEDFEDDLDDDYDDDFDDEDEYEEEEESAPVVLETSFKQHES